MANILTLLFSLILALLMPPTNAFYLNISDPSSRIVNGVLTTIDQAKFMVNLRILGRFACGGSLVAPKILLTAAHCVDGLNPSDVSIIAGATYLNEKGIKRSVSKIYLASEFSDETLDMDIALLILNKPLEGANISTIELCKSKWKAGDLMQVYGWGQIGSSGKISNQLRTVKIPVVDQKKCIDMYKDVEAEVTNSMFCIGDLKGKDSCNGDSGGPAVFNNKLCGVVSWGESCATDKYPGVYANVLYAWKFIYKIMNKYGRH